MEELKEKYGVKISSSTLDRIVRMGKEAKGNQVCFVRKMYDTTNKSHLTSEVREDYVELITEFAHTWSLQCPPEGIQEIGSFEAFTNTKQRMMELVYKAWDKISWEVMDKS